MKIRPYLLVSISYISLCSLAQADISAVEDEFIFTHTSNTHLASQPQLLSSPILPQTPSEHRDFSAPISLALTDGSTASVASVCFITDAGNCGGNDYGGANTPDGDSSGGSSSGGSSSSGGDACAPNDAWCLDNQKRCSLEGYNQTSCNSVSTSTNFCPYDNRFFEKCVCKPNLIDCPAGQVGVGESCDGKYASCQCDPKLVSCSSVQVGVGATCGGKYESCTCNPNLQTCTKPYYGVGESCGGKYASCQLDNARACKEDGYTRTGSCNDVQTINKKCPYDPTYFDKCVCRGDLQKCASPLQGVGTACGGKYKSCKCPTKYKVCDCGKAAGASSCTWNGVTKYTSCKACCDDTCPSGTSKTYKGAYAGTTECGSKCYKCNCPYGTGPNFSGTPAGSSECGTCYRCSNTCSQGSLYPRCNYKDTQKKVATTECGNACYECVHNPDCDVRGTSCRKPYECNYNSCNICESCSYNYDCDAKGTTCRGPEYICDYNSCGICASCSYNRDCDATDKSCDYGCAETNSCGKCIKCASGKIEVFWEFPYSCSYVKENEYRSDIHMIRSCVYPNGTSTVLRDWTERRYFYWSNGTSPHDMCMAVNGTSGTYEEGPC